MAHLLIIKVNRCLKKVIHKKAENERRLLYATFTAKLDSVFFRKALFYKGFILKPTETAYVFLKCGTRDFHNSSQFERLACFSVTITRKFEHFQYFDFETNVLKNQNFFQNIGAPLFS